MASPKSGGVLVNDGTTEGEHRKAGRSGSKFRNSVQSGLKVESAGCSISSCGISNKAEKSPTTGTEVVTSVGAGNSTVSALGTQQCGVELTECGGNHT